MKIGEKKKSEMMHQPARRAYQPYRIEVYLTVIPFQLRTARCAEVFDLLLIPDRFGIVFLDIFHLCLARHEILHVHSPLRIVAYQDRE